MLQITVPASEWWDEKNEMFVNNKECTLQLEHSLVSLAKWESKWKKPFISSEAKTFEETIDYIRCMTINQNVDSDVYKSLTDDNIKKVKDYINDSMTATTFTKHNASKHNSEAITAELIYYWMISLNIPIKFEKWHLNRLMTLIHVCDLKNQPEKKQSMKERMSTNAALNAARRQRFNSKG